MRKTLESDDCALIKCEYYFNRKCNDRNPIYRDGPCRKSYYWKTPEGMIEYLRRERKLKELHQRQ